MTDLAETKRHIRDALPDKRQIGQKGEKESEESGKARKAI